MRPCVLGEDLEDHFGAVEHPRLELELEVALLTGAEVVVADDKVERAFQLELAQLLDLAHADEMRGVDRGTTLDVGTNDVGPGSASEIRELCHLLANQLWSGAGQHQADQVRPLARGLRGDQSLSRLRRAMASARRASGAVTESRK